MGTRQATLLAFGVREDGLDGPLRDGSQESSIRVAPLGLFQGPHLCFMSLCCASLHFSDGLLYLVLHGSPDPHSTTPSGSRPHHQQMTWL